jgi:hypothetical protein
MASVSSASGTMTALPAKILSAGRVCPVAVPGMSRMPTASAWVTPMPMTSSSFKLESTPLQGWSPLFLYLHYGVELMYEIAVFNLVGLISTQTSIFC